MAMFDFLTRSPIHQGLQRYEATPGGVLLDVRSPQEYRQGHIPGSENIPLQDIESLLWLREDRKTPLFVYCYSGARSGQAAAVLKELGYQNVSNIGGIAAYKGKVVR